jgi:hypothetical protein
LVAVIASEVGGYGIFEMLSGGEFEDVDDT